MKHLNKIMLIALAAGFGFASCGDDYEDYKVGVKQSADNAGVFFVDASQNLEYAPDAATEFEVKIGRLNPSAALSLPITVVANGENVFEVPAKVDFAAGDSVATVTVNFPKAELGQPYTLTLGLPDEYKSLYSAFDGSLTTTVTVSRIKWEPIGTCYWVDGIVGAAFGVDASLAYAVEVEKAVTPTSTKFRFATPHAYLCTGMDEAGIGYVGYLYNEEGDCDEQEHTFVITVTGTEAVHNTLDLGIDWGYGMMSTGMSREAFDDSSYPLGYIASDGSKVVFPAGSEYLCIPGYGYYETGSASTLYLKPDELLIPDEYKPVGVGYYDFAAFLRWPAKGYADYCYFELCESTETPGNYRIDDWDLLKGGDFFFSVDKENGSIAFDDQESGYEDDDHGMYYVRNFIETKSYFDYETLKQVVDTVSQSLYDAENDVFKFNTIYYYQADEENVDHAYGVETFQMLEWYSDEEENEEESASAPARIRKAVGKSIAPRFLNKKAIRPAKK